MQVRRRRRQNFAQNEHRTLRAGAPDAAASVQSIHVLHCVVYVAPDIGAYVRCLIPSTSGGVEAALSESTGRYGGSPDAFGAISRAREALWSPPNTGVVASGACLESADIVLIGYDVWGPHIYFTRLLFFLDPNLLRPCPSSPPCHC